MIGQHIGSNSLWEIQLAISGVQCIHVGSASDLAIMRSWVRNRSTDVRSAESHYKIYLQFCSSCDSDLSAEPHGLIGSAHNLGIHRAPGQPGADTF